MCSSVCVHVFESAFACHCVCGCKRGLFLFFGGFSCFVLFCLGFFFVFCWFFFFFDVCFHFTGAASQLNIDKQVKLTALLASPRKAFWNIERSPDWYRIVRRLK